MTDSTTSNFNTQSYLADIIGSSEQTIDNDVIDIRLYLTTLIVEKGHSVYDNVPREGHIGLVWENLIEFCEQVNPIDKYKIIENCTKIDFANGNVFHFLNYLIDGMLAATMQEI